MMTERPHLVLVHEYPTTHMQTRRPFHLSMANENSTEDEHPEVWRLRLHVLMRDADTDSKASSVACVLISRRFGFDAHVAFQRSV